MSVAPATSTTTPVSTKWTLLPLPKTESPIEFFELLGVVCGAAVIVYLGWILKGRLRARRLRARIAAGHFPPGYTVTRGGRLRPPPNTWRGRMSGNRVRENIGVSLQQLDRIAPAFQGERPTTGKVERNEPTTESDCASALEAQECTICLDDLGESEMKRILPCQHSYHSHCIESWAVKNNACPNCRNKILDENAEQPSTSPSQSASTATSPGGDSTSSSNGGLIRPPANVSFVTARLDTSSSQANGRFWVSPRAGDNALVPGLCVADADSTSIGSLGMTFATARDLCSPTRARPSPKLISEVETETPEV